MQSDELDDLFRQQLGGHASAPGADLWARLQARTEAAAGATGSPAADPLDAQFRAGLAGHATPPRRELWEQLEDEHLRPRQRRRPVVAWGRLAVAASLLLFVLAGGAGLWWRGRTPATGQVATHSTAQTPAASSRVGAGPSIARPAAGQATAALGPTADLATAGAANSSAASSPSQFHALAGTPTLAATSGRREKTAEYFDARATASRAPASSSPVASHRPPANRRLPQAATRLDATGTALAQRSEQPATAGPPAAPSPTLAAALTSTLAEPQVIEVEVRRGAAAATTRPAPAVVAAAPAADDDTPDRPRLRLGGVLRQAGRALRGEPVSLTDATASLPDSVTVRARLGGRQLSKTIRF